MRANAPALHIAAQVNGRLNRPLIGSPVLELCSVGIPHNLAAKHSHQIRIASADASHAALKLLLRGHIVFKRHRRVGNIRGINAKQRPGIGNLSIDLMYGLPGETIERWEADLRQALELAPEHISAYHLIYEEGTALWRLREQHQVAEADEELSLTLYRHLVKRLKKNGYEHYEISNFCRPGRFSRHNSSYWDGTPYLGCGAAAHSYNGMARQANVASIDGYIAGIRQGSPDVETEPLDLATRYNDCIVTALRTCWGVSLPLLTERFGKKLADYCLRMAQPHLQRGTLELLADHLKLTERGVFVSDDILSDLLWVEA